MTRGNRLGQLKQKTQQDTRAQSISQMPIYRRRIKKKKKKKKKMIDDGIFFFSQLRATICTRYNSVQFE